MSRTEGVRLIAVSTLVVGLLGVTVAVASTPSGLERKEVSRTTLIGGGPVEFQAGLDSAVLQVTLAPGGSTGWHSHPSPGVFMVDQGTLSPPVVPLPSSSPPQ